LPEKFGFTSTVSLQLEYYLIPYQSSPKYNQSPERYRDMSFQGFFVVAIKKSKIYSGTTSGQQII